MEIIDKLKDRYITWRTGKNKQQREWEAWYEDNVNYRATRIKDMFKKFEHVIIVNPDKFFSHEEMGWWIPCQDAKQYFHPQRTLGDNAVWRFERVIKYPSTSNEWEVNELGGSDTVFVATNNREDAIMIALKYA